MKKLIIVLILIMNCGLTFSQERLKWINSPQNLKLKSESKDSVFISSDLQNVQYCLHKYFLQRRAGLVISVAGSVLYGVNTSGSDFRKAAGIFGFSMLLVGTFVTIDADKWIKRASISISPPGITIKF